MPTEFNRAQVSCQRIARLDNLELMRATFVGQSFSRHIHENFAIGVVESGTGAFAYRGTNWVVPRRKVFVIHPGEVHTGGGLKDHLCTYRVIYPGEQLLRNIASELIWKTSDSPFFPETILSDTETADQLWQVHVALEAGASDLEQDSLLFEVFGRLIQRHARAEHLSQRLSRESLAVKRVKEHLEAHCVENVPLSSLTSLTGLSAFHLIHCFRQEVGLPPHAYQIQLRVLRAKAFIARGHTIVDAALDAGFTHQSHLNRHFKRLLGFTPGQYRRTLVLR
jgi:AraC-like DNA-binding protein